MQGCALHMVVARSGPCVQCAVCFRRRLWERSGAEFGGGFSGIEMILLRSGLESLGLLAADFILPPRRNVQTMDGSSISDVL